MNGLYIVGSILPTVKSGFFKPELQRIEYLYLGNNQIVRIQPQAFQYLVKLKWIHLSGNFLKTLPYQLFKNQPDLIYISFQSNQIASIHPNFFAGLNKLKLVEFDGNVCINDKIGCETCLITQSDLRGKLQGCFDNCSNGTDCHTSYNKPSQTTEIPQTTTENPIESNSTEKVVEGIGELIDSQLGELSQNITASLRDTQKVVEEVKQELSDLKTSVENMPKVIEKAVETNNQNLQECCTSNQKAVEKLQEAMEDQIKEMKEELATNVETGLQHSRNVEKELKELKDFLKQELNEKKDMENQMKNLKLELALIIQEKLDALEDRLTNGG